MRWSLVSFALAIVALGPCSPASAQTMVPPGALTASQVWSPAGSPYILTGDVTVPFNTLLVVQPGVEVRVNPGDASFGGFDSFRTEIRVDGTLHAVGTAEQPIVFEAATMASRTTWSGIRCEFASQSATLDHIVVRNAQYGVYSAAFDPAFSLNRSKFEECGIALTTCNGSPVFDALEVTACDAVAQFGCTSNPTLTNALIHHNAFGVQSLNGVVLLNCTIDSSGYGVYAQGGLTWVRNCSITNNSAYGVYREAAAAVGLEANNVWNSGTSDYFGVTPDGASISIDPVYEDAVEYRVGSGSPNIDAGVALPTVPADRYGDARPYDGDGAGGPQWDIGAHEFGAGCAGVSVVVGPSSVLAAPGAIAGFAVVASGSGPFTYHWRKDGAPLADGPRISGASTDTLTVDPVGPADFGVYDCLVFNACGSSASPAAALCVGSPFCEGNANADAVVDFNDIVSVLTNWLSVCP